MRSPLEQIEQINTYLSGGMTPDQLARFEAEVAGDPVLKDQLTFQQDMSKVVQRRALRSEIQSVAKQYGGASSGFSWMAVIVSGIVAVAGIVGYYLWDHDSVPAAPKVTQQQHIEQQPAAPATAPVTADTNAAPQLVWNPEEMQRELFRYMHSADFERPDFLGISDGSVFLPLPGIESAAISTEQSMTLTDFADLDFVPKAFAKQQFKEEGSLTRSQLDSLYFTSDGEDAENRSAEQQYITVNCWNTLPGAGPFTESRLHLKGRRPKKNAAFGYVFDKEGNKLKNVTIVYSFYGERRTVTTDASGSFEFKLYGKIVTDVSLMISGYGMATLPGIVFQSKKGTYFQVDLPVKEQAESAGKNTKPRGIDPLAVKAIRTEPFAHTFLATHAFETRLQQLYLLPNGQELLDLYVNNLNKDLSDVDAMVAKRLNGEPKTVFEQFSALKQTHAAAADIDQKALTDYYNRTREKN